MWHSFPTFLSIVEQRGWKMTDHDDVTDPSPDLDVPLAASATVPGLCTRCYAPLHGFLLPHYADWTRRSQLIDPEICVLTSDDVSSYFSPHPTTPHLCASCVPSEPSADTQTPSLDEPRHPGHPSFSISPSTEGSHAGPPLPRSTHTISSQVLRRKVKASKVLCQQSQA